MRKRWQGLLGLALGAAIMAGGTLGASAHGNSMSRVSRPMSIVQGAKSGVHDLARFVGLEEDEASVSPGTLDDGKDLLPQASVTIEEAIAAAKTAASGYIGEIDLEHYHGTLVFNVDVGDLDVKVDANTGEVLGSATD